MLPQAVLNLSNVLPMSVMLYGTGQLIVDLAKPSEEGRTVGRRIKELNSEKKFTKVESYRNRLLKTISRNIP